MTTTEVKLKARCADESRRTSGVASGTTGFG
jgi:hypothetical protein